MNDLLIKEFISLVPFEGFSENALETAAVKLGKEIDLYRFPKGIYSVLDELGLYFDGLLSEKMEKASLSDMRIRDRIFEVVKSRLDLYKEEIPSYRSVLGKIICFFPREKDYLGAVGRIFCNADTFWRLAGDTSTDFSFYTKRAILSVVYSSTLLFFVRDYSDDHEETNLFLRRRINNVMTFHKVKAKVKGFFGF